MQDLITFLRARLDEVEQRATACFARDWRMPYEDLITDRDHPGFKAVADDSIIFHVRHDRDAEAQHAVHNDPDFVLSDVAAKRAIVEEIQRVARAAGGRTTAQGSIVAQLAMPYADHPDYRPEWRP